MILFFENGRLGNQLFQYCALRAYFPNNRLVFFGCESLQGDFDNVVARFVRKTRVGRWIPFKVLKSIVVFLANVRILGRVTENRESASFNLVVRKGLFWKVFVPLNVFFQHDDVVARIEKPPVLNGDLREKAIIWLSSRGIDPALDYLVSVHVRRGDYLLWPSREFPAVLGLGWYKRAMDMIQEKVSRPVFVLMSDDQHYLRDVFEESDTLLISDNPPGVDLAIMSLCHSGILSASSFAWWGAFYAQCERRRNAQFLAPKYWGGHRSKKWHPANFRADWITYIE